MKIQFLIFFLILSTGLFAQNVEIPTYERQPDGSYKKVVKTSNDDDEGIDSLSAVNDLIVEANRAYRSANRLINNLRSVRKIGQQLEQELQSLFGVDYTALLQQYDTLYAQPNTPANEFAYESTLKVGKDTTYNVHVFINNQGNQVLRIQGDTTNTNYQLRHDEYNTRIRLGNQTKALPGFSSAIRLELVSTNSTRFRIYRRVTDDNTTVTLRIKLPE